MFQNSIDLTDTHITIWHAVATYQDLSKSKFWPEEGLLLLSYNMISQEGSLGIELKTFMAFYLIHIYSLNCSQAFWND